MKDIYEARSPKKADFRLFERRRANGLEAIGVITADFISKLRERRSAWMKGSSDDD